jgi:hypothetical protein
LRLLYILFKHFDDFNEKLTVPEAVVDQLAEFLLGNIYKFRKIFESPQNYAIDIPTPLKSNLQSVIPPSRKSTHNSQI